MFFARDFFALVPSLFFFPTQMDQASSEQSRQVQERVIQAFELMNCATGWGETNVQIRSENRWLPATDLGIQMLSLQHTDSALAATVLLLTTFGILMLPLRFVMLTSCPSNLHFHKLNRQSNQETLFVLGMFSWENRMLL